MRHPISSQFSSPAGYSLVEVMVAAAVLLIGIAAAASLSMTMTSQEESNARVSRAINLQEQAARLYQLGLDPTVISTGTGSVLPLDSSITNLTFSATSTNITGLGTVEVATCSLIFTAGVPLSTNSVAQARTNTITVVRPSTR